LTTDPVKARCIQKKVQQAQRQRHPGFTALVEAASRNEMTPRVSAIWATKLAASCGTSIPPPPLPACQVASYRDTFQLVMEYARRVVSQREANGTAFDGTGRSTTRGASTQLRVCFSGGAELWARPE